MGSTVYLHGIASVVYQFSLIQATEMLTFHETLHRFILVVHNDNMLIESDEQEFASILDALVKYI